MESRHLPSTQTCSTWRSSELWRCSGFVTAGLTSFCSSPGALVQHRAQPYSPPPAHLPFAFCLWCSVRAARCSSSLFKTLSAFTLLCVAVDTSLRLCCVFSHCKTGTAGLAQFVRRSSRPKSWGCELGWLWIWVTQDVSWLCQRAAALPVVALQNCLAK